MFLSEHDCDSCSSAEVQPITCAQYWEFLLQYLIDVVFRCVRQPGECSCLITQSDQFSGNRFNYQPTKVLSREGAEIDDLEVVRDGDHLHIVSSEEQEEGDFNGLSLNPSNCYRSFTGLLSSPKEQRFCLNNSLFEVQVHSFFFVQSDVQSCFANRGG